MVKKLPVFLWNCTTPWRLVCTQQLESDKGHAMLLRALSRVSDAFELHIWGKGREEKGLRKLAQDLGLFDRVVWHGFSMNIMDDLQAGDIFLLASYSEGLPNTLLEGMAAGSLPITREVGGVAEVIPEALAEVDAALSGEGRPFCGNHQCCYKSPGYGAAETA